MLAAETIAGAEMAHAGRTLTPLARSIRVLLPGLAGGLVWNRPVGVLVRDGEGRRVLAVHDRTRWIQLWLLGGGLAAAFLLRRLGRRWSRPQRFFRR